MAKYQNAYRDNLDEVIEESVVQAPEQAEEENLSKEETTWKKRYGDLRSHQAKTENALKKEIEELKEKFETAAKGQMKFPKTPEEVQAWVKKYPDVAAIVDTIAQMRALEAKDMNGKEIGRIKELEAKIQKERDELELGKLHPDFFSDLIHDEHFVEWLDNDAPQWCVRALREDGQPVKDAAEAIDYYKTKFKKSKSRDTSAAKQVASRNRAEVPEGGSKWTESRVEKLSDREYEQYEAEIMKAMRSDPSFYDISGASR